MKQIQLTQGQVAQVCDCHFHLVKDYKWIAMWDSHKQQYSARRRASFLERTIGFPQWVRMHVIINNTPKGFHTDHVDNNSLNNQCSNLRTATPNENQHNRGKSRNNTSGYKGVTNSGSLSKPWHAQISHNGQHYHLGNYKTPEEAAQVYDNKAIQLHGRFANINFPT